MEGIRSHNGASCQLREAIALPVHMRSRVVEVTSVYVPENARKLGIGTDLMLSVCKEADDAGKYLLCQPKPFDRHGMDGKRLIQWYEDLGFDVIQWSPVVMMVREPDEHAPEQSLVAQAVASALQ